MSDQETTTAVTVAETGGAVAAFDPSMFEQYEGQGLEHVSLADKAIPRFYLLQKGSPQCDEDSDMHVPGAKKGMLWNSLTGELYDTTQGVRMLLVAYFKEYVERDPDSSKFIRTHPLNSPLRATCVEDEKRRLFLPNGNKFVETVNHFVILIHDGKVSQGILSMASSSMKASKKWIALADGIRLPRKNGQGKYKPPIFAFEYLLTVLAKQDGNMTWVHWDVECGQMVSDPELVEYAASFAKAYAEGTVKAAPEADGAEGGGSNADADTDAPNDDNVPF